MKQSLELLKQLIFVIFGIFTEIISNIWKPIYTTTIKMLFIAALVWGVAHFVPHDLPYIHDVTFVGWLSVIAIYRLITVEYDDFDDDEEDEDPTVPGEVPNYLQDETADVEQTPLAPEVIPPPPRNIAEKNDRESSTRE